MDRRIFLFMFIVILLLGCQQKSQKNYVLEIIPVKVSRVEFKEINETLDYVGNIKAEDEVIVYPKVSGKVIEKLKKDGDTVGKGMPIAYIDRDEVGLKYELAPVESPLSGILGRVYVDIGSNVTAQTPLALIVNMDKVKINLDIPEKYIPRILLGQESEISVDAYPAKKFLGKVTKLSPVLDLSTRAAPAEITIENPGHLLKSGMFARVKLIIQTRQEVPIVIKEAILGKEPNAYVYIIKNNLAVLRKVMLGIRQDVYYEIKEGLSQGDMVVVMGQQRLYDGAKVSVEE